MEEKMILNANKDSSINLCKKANDLAMKAEKEKKVSLIADSNASRKRAAEIDELAEKCMKKVKKMEVDLKNSG